MVTEDEAKRMWCPFGRIEGRAGGSNDPTKVHGKAHCIGSACMAWRWSPETGGGYCGVAGTPTS